MSEEPQAAESEPDSSKADFWHWLRDTLQRAREDIECVLERDPAARSALEVLLTYPGVHAIWFHRVAQRLWRKERVLGARVVAHAARFITGIEIHPAARIGRRVFIDHGMGVVIGETASVGDECILFKGVVLGGTQAERKLRHPQLGRRVVVGTNACILGNIQIGEGARIGSGSVVVRPVPPGATVVGVPGRVIPPKSDRRARFDATLDHASLPDPINEMLRSLRDENERLRWRLEKIEAALALPAENEEHDSHLIDAATSTPDLPPQHGG